MKSLVKVCVFNPCWKNNKDKSSVSEWQRVWVAACLRDTHSARSINAAIERKLIIITFNHFQICFNSLVLIWLFILVKRFCFLKNWLCDLHVFPCIGGQNREGAMFASRAGLYWLPLKNILTKRKKHSNGLAPNFLCRY